MQRVQADSERAAAAAESELESARTTLRRRDVELAKAKAHAKKFESDKVATTRGVFRFLVVSVWQRTKACTKRTGAATSVARRQRECLARAGRGM